jgi:hypothetical protein
LVQGKRKSLNCLRLEFHFCLRDQIHHNRTFFYEKRLFRLVLFILI